MPPKPPLLNHDEATFSRCLRLAGEMIYIANKTRFYYDYPSITKTVGLQPIGDGLQKPEFI